jgi:hypothetical protein
VTVEGTMCKTVFPGKFIDLFAVVFTLFTSHYFHMHAELLSIAHPYNRPSEWRDFSAVSNKGRLSLGVIWAWVQVLMCQIELLNMELWLLTNMEEAMFDAWLEVGDKMEEGEYADEEISEAE